MRLVFCFLLLSGISGSLFGQAAEPFTFEENPTSALASARLSLPPKNGSVLQLDTKAGVEGNMGGSSYTYTAKLPAWRGVFSELNFTYKSEGGFGFLGHGFSTNIPSIELSSRLGVPNANSPLVSSEDGELVAVGPNSFRARIDKKFRVFRRNGSSIVMFDGQGRRYHFGLDPASREESRGLIVRWWLSQIEDRAGFKVVMSYKKFSGDNSYPTGIYFVDGTREGPGTVSYATSFRYEALPATSVITSYREGIVTRFDHIVKSIDVYWTEAAALDTVVNTDLAAQFASHRVSSWRFTHNFSGALKRPLLSTIQQFGRTDSAADAKPLERLSYSTTCLDGDNANCSTPTIPLVRSRVPDVNEFLPETSRWIDINSDGLPDLLTRNEALKWGVSLNETVDPSDRLLKFGGRQPIPFPLLSFSGPTQAFLDVNGDRRIDLVYFEAAENRLKVSLQQTSGQLFGEELALDSLKVLPGDTRSGAFVDLNADGLVDYVAYEDVPRGDLLLSYSLNQSTGTRLQFAPLQELPLKGLRADPGRLLWVDVNGDGLADLVNFVGDGIASEDQLQIALNLGHFQFDAFHNASIPGYRGVLMPRFADMNGDGVNDLVIGSPSTDLAIYLASPGHVYMKAAAGVETALIAGAALFDVGDANGSGSNDLLIGTATGELLIFDPYLGQPAKAPFLLAKVISDLGNDRSYEYQASTKGVIFAPSNFPVTRQVVRQELWVGSSYDRNGRYRPIVSRKRIYSFSEGAYDISRNEFAGFKHADFIDYQLPETPGAVGQEHRSIYYTSEQDFFLKGIEKSHEIRRLSDQKVFKLDEYEYIARPVFEGLDHRLVVPKQSTMTEFEGGNKRVQREVSCTEVDPKFMLPKIRTKTYFHNNLAIRSTKTEFHAPSQSWLVLMPIKQTLLDLTEANGKILDERSFQYNQELCKLSSWSQLNQAGIAQVKAEVTYDSYGSIASIRDGRGFVRRFEYGEPGRFLPTEQHRQVQDDVWLTVAGRYNYLAGGQVAEYIDENGLSTRFNYDGLGRISEWLSPKDPDEPSNRYTYEWGTPQTPSKVRTFSRLIEKESIIAYDAWLKVKAQFHPTANGFKVSNFLSTDAWDFAWATTNRAVIEGANFDDLKLTADYLVNQKFDEQGRLLSIDQPAFQGARAISTMNYGATPEYFWSETINAEKERSIRKSDAGSRIFEITLGIQQPYRLSMSYDAGNRIKKLSINSGIERTYTWTAANKIASLVDSQFGSIDYEYDTEDNVLSYRVQSPNKSGAYSRFYRYDGVGRLVEERFLPNSLGSLKDSWEKALVDFRYTYDEVLDTALGQTFTKGKLTSQQIFPGASYHYSYDENGNTRDRYLKLYKDTFHEGFEYDALNRKISIEYPNDRVVKIEYDPRAGLVKSLGDLLPDIDYNAFNDVVGYSGPGFTESWQLESNTGLMTQHQVKTESLNYTKNVTLYDLLGRLKGTQIQDHLYSSKVQQYSYGEQGFLETASVDFSGPLTNQTPFKSASTYTFNADGRMTASDAGTFTYQPSSIRSEGSIPGEWLFDSLGRLNKSPAIASLHWLSSNRLACVQGEGAKRISFESLPDGTLFSTTLRNGAEQKSTVFISELAQYEKESKRLTQYYYLGNKRIAVESKGELRYLVNDNLGTPAIEHSGGKVLASQQLGPFGNAQGGSENKMLTNYLFAEGHGIAETPFYQMGTRLMDPRIGQFISPDLTFIIDPNRCISSPFECNPYLYARNDPINFHDPEGKEIREGLRYLRDGAVASYQSMTYKQTSAYASTEAKSVNTHVKVEASYAFGDKAFSVSKETGFNGAVSTTTLKVDSNKVVTASQDLAYGNAFVKGEVGGTLDTRGAKDSKDWNGKTSFNAPRVGQGWVVTPDMGFSINKKGDVEVKLGYGPVLKGGVADIDTAVGAKVEFNMQDTTGPRLAVMMAIYEFAQSAQNFNWAKELFLSK